MLYRVFSIMVLNNRLCNKSLFPTFFLLLPIPPFFASSVSFFIDHLLENIFNHFPFAEDYVWL